MRTSFLALVLIFPLLSFAQVKIAVKGGYSYAFAKASYNAKQQKVEGKHGFNLGVLFKANFEAPLHFSPYIQFSSRGFIIKPDTGSIKKVENSIQYIDIVPALSVDFPKGNGSFVISGGPVLGITNFGKEKTTDKNNVTQSSSMSFGYGGYGWFDLGIAGSIGYHVKKIFVEANYQLGLTNINNLSEFDGRNIKNRAISLNIGYYLK